ncbi:MAG: glycosyltransferase family 2 protein, partial [Alphaproteobacteria bacterium]|nr:glycosyltransferase family 2 protein [Alphaproteobacteria bacterium]
PSPTPKVSVIIPLFNHAQYVGTAIESIVKQTYKNWELIIIDDGSTDGSAKVARSWADKDSRVHYYYQPNGGVASARNHGLARARGDYVAWQDADDVSLPRRLARQLLVLKKNTAIGGVGCWLRLVDSRGRFMGRPQQLAARRPVGRRARDQVKYLMGGGRYGYANNPTFMVRRSLIDKAGGFRRLRVGEDMDFLFRIEEQQPLMTIQAALYHYRQHGDNSETRLKKIARNKRLEIAVGNLVYFLSAYARRLYGVDPIGHIPATVPLARVRHLLLFLPYGGLYRYWRRILLINKMSVMEFLVRLLLAPLSSGKIFR